MKISKTRIGILLLALSIMLSGCDSLLVSGNDPVLIQREDALTKTGIYAWEGGSFYVAPFIGASFDSDDVPENAAEYMYRYIWIEGASSGKIPTVYDDSESGLVYVNISEPPNKIYQEMTLESFTDRGYTVGVRVTAQEGAFVFNTQAMCAGSSAARIIKESVSTPKAFVVSEINEIALSDTQPFWDHNGIITALEPNAKYMFTGYQGTAYRELIMDADARYFVSDGVQMLAPEMIEPTRLGYFVIHLPDDLVPGLYCINQKYLFFYAVREEQEPTSTANAT